MKQQILFLHGAGGSDKERSRYLQDILVQNDFECFSFNFTGHGGNNLSKSSLEGRMQEAEKAIQEFHLQEPFNLCGSSMGGYIAIKLCEKYNVENLFLFAPAVYTDKAFKLNFNEKFSETIRQKDSWKQSDVFDILKNFTGNVVIFIGNKDEVIPHELIQMIDANLVKAKSKQIITIPECTHSIHRWLQDHNDWAKKVSHKIEEVLE